MRKFFKYVLVLWVVTFASCSSNSEDYVKSVPANAAFVLRMDWKSIREKSKFEGSKLERMLAESDTLIKGFLADANKMGVDINSPLYSYMSDGEKEMGLAFKVSNANSLTKYLKSSVKDGKYSEKNGVMLFRGKGSYFAYNNECGLWLFYKGVIPHEDVVLSKFMNEKSGFATTEAYKKMMSRKQDVNVSIVSPNDGFCERNGIPVHKLNLSFDILFDKGEIKAHTEMFCDSEEDQKALDKYKAGMGVLNGDYLNTFSEDDILFVTAQLKPASADSTTKEDMRLFYDKYPQLAEIMESEKYRNVLGDLSANFYGGDFAFNLGLKDKMPLFSVENKMKGEINLDNFVGLVDTFLKISVPELNVAFKKVDNRNYEVVNLVTGNKVQDLGYDDNMNFFVAFSGMKDGLFSHDDFKKVDVKSDLKRANAFVFLNMEPICPYFAFLGSNTYNAVSKIANAQLFLMPNLDVDLNVILHNKDEQSLVVLRELVESLVGN